MAENIPPTSLGSLAPPPPTSAGAPGQQSYEGAPGNGQGNPHMPPPPLPPVVIPQNNNPIPTAITSPGGIAVDILTPGSTGGYVRRAAPEPNKRALYVGGLDPRVTEEVLRQIFETTGHVQSVKIIPDKNVSAQSIPEVKPLLFFFPSRCSHSTSVPYQYNHAEHLTTQHALFSAVLQNLSPEPND